MKKIFSNHLKYNQVIHSYHKSLKNLNIDYIDLYQIHWPPGSFGSNHVPLEETMSAMADLKAQGKILALGVSNFSLSQRKEAVTYGNLDKLRPIADGKNITLGQLSLAGVISHPGISAIAGARNTEQATQNADAAYIRLSDEGLGLINEISQMVTNHLDDNPVMWKW